MARIYWPADKGRITVAVHICGQTLLWGGLLAAFVA